MVRREHEGAKVGVGFWICLFGLVLGFHLVLEHRLVFAFSICLFCHRFLIGVVSRVLWVFQVISL